MILLDAPNLAGVGSGAGDFGYWATAKVYGCPLVTVDAKIVGYSEIEMIS